MADDSTQSQSPPIIDDDEVVIGGGSINEKKRSFINDIRPNSKTDTGAKDLNHFDPEHTPAHLFHALMGLDRYPNYISRWNYNLLDDVERLESALEDQLEKIRIQKRQLLLRNEHVRSIVQATNADLYTSTNLETVNNLDANRTGTVDWSILRPPTSWQEVRDQVLHKKASEAIFKSKMFSSQPYAQSRHINHKNNITNINDLTSISVQDVLEGKVIIELDAAQLEGWLDQELFDVYSFPLLSETFCIRLKNTIQNLITLSRNTTSEVERQGGNANSLSQSTAVPQFGSRPIDLDTIGASWINNLIFHLIVRPVSKHLFTNSEHITNNDLDWRQGYVAGYSHDPTTTIGVQRQRLVPHTDDAEVTLNVGLSTGGGVDYEGGDLVFWGLRGTEEEGKLNGCYTPMIGRAIIHSGRHLHEVKEVTNNGHEVDSKGAEGRFAFVIWSRSWKGLRNGICPCCWLNRRQDERKGKVNRCMCSPKWN